MIIENKKSIVLTRGVFDHVIYLCAINGNAKIPYYPAPPLLLFGITIEKALYLFFNN